MKKYLAILVLLLMGMSLLTVDVGVCIAGDCKKENAECSVNESGKPCCYGACIPFNENSGNGKCPGAPPPTPVLGCTDPDALNYNSNATQDDGSCQYPVPGCTDPEALNYNPNATDDNGSCKYEQTPVCEDETALNYGQEGECEYEQAPICEDENALNYGQEGECEYEETPVCEDESALNYGEEGECQYDSVYCDDESALNYGEEAQCEYPEPTPAPLPVPNQTNYQLNPVTGVSSNILDKIQDLWYNLIQGFQFP